jgi:hypothetical protein
MKRVIHVVPDDKFTDAAVEVFSHICFLENRFLLLKQHNYPIKYIKRIDKIEIINTPKDLIDTVNTSADMVILHSLFFNPKYLLRIDQKIILIWSTWGYDIYSEKGFFNKRRLLVMALYKPYSKKYVHQYKKETFPAVIKHIIHSFFDNNYYKLFTKRVNYIANEFSYEFNLMKRKNNISAKNIYFLYPSREDDLYTHITGKNILLGNSADICNNHIDIIYFLKDIDLTARKIIVPLSYPSYPDRPAYVRLIRETIETMQNISSEILENFLPLEKYYQKISTCAYAIFGHIRQQATNNIVKLLFNGCKIFLYKESITYNALVEKGFILFTIDDDLNYDSLNRQLTEDERQHNKALYLDYYNYDRFILHLSDSLKDISF